MKKFFFILITLSILFSCNKDKNTKLTFLDEYILKDSTVFQNSIIGGLSGVDYANGFYYFVIDDAKKPRFLKAKITIDNYKIKDFIVDDVFYLNDTITAFYKNNVLDLESVFYDTETEQLNFVSEGSIAYRKSPSVFTTDEFGRFKYNYKIPTQFISNEIVNLKHNGAFEGSSRAFNNKGFWVAMESPLINDGDEPTFTEKSSPIRVTYFDKKAKIATKQYAYQLEHITKPSKGSINLNGLTAILEYKKNHFFIVERTYQSEFGKLGNTVRIFEAIIDEKTTNILEVDSLRETEYIPLKKRLVFDFETVRNELTNGIVDNIEGITFGPVLPNGNKSLLLVSDDNFQIYGKQLNQFILLEILN